jgi:hypothetical protein
MASEEELKAEIERLRIENEALKKPFGIGSAAVIGKTQLVEERGLQ